MGHCLSSILSILRKYLILYFKNFLKLSAYFVSSHEQIDGLYFGEILQFWYLATRADEHMSWGEWLVVDHRVYVFSKQKDLGGRDNAFPEDDFS